VSQASVEPERSVGAPAAPEAGSARSTRTACSGPDRSRGLRKTVVPARSTVPEALAAALDVCPGKPLINSINGEERSLSEILPLAKERGAGVVGLAMGEEGVPTDVEDRVEIARQVIRESISGGIPREDGILDPLALAVGADTSEPMATLKATRLLAQIEGANLTLGASNISFGLPDRSAVNDIFVALASFAGVTCPIIDPSKGRRALLIADLMLGRDDFAERYLGFVRQARLRSPN